MSTLQVDVAPSVLIWARESIGLSQADAAKKLGMNGLDLRFLEEGVGNVSLPRLRRMADVYERPLMAFFLSEPPDVEVHIPDFRLAPENRSRPWSYALHEGFRRALMQREVSLEIAEITGEPTSDMDIRLRLGDDPENAGEKLRQWLGANDTLEFASTKQTNAFNTWVRLVEDKAILVAQIPNVKIEEMRGFTIADEPFPIIALNSKDSIRGKTFTLLHELVHITLHIGGLCDLEDGSPSLPTATDRVEWFCNQVAAATLVPRHALLREAIVESAPASHRWSDDELHFLADRFGVSAEAMLLRLVTLNRASRDFYRERRSHFLRLYWHQRERNEQKAGGNANYYQLQLRDFGRRYVATVLDAYERQEITASDLADYLRMKVNNVPKLAELLGTER